MTKSEDLALSEHSRGWNDGFEQLSLSDATTIDYLKGYVDGLRAAVLIKWRVAEEDS